MNSQQHVVFLKQLLETDSSGVRGTETITPWNAPGSLVVGLSQEWQKRVCYSCTQLYSLSPLQIHVPNPQHKLFPRGLALPRDFSALATGNSIPTPVETPALGSPDTSLSKVEGGGGWASSSLVRLCVWVQSEKRGPDKIKSFTKYTGLLGGFKYSFCRADIPAIALVFSCFTEK